MVLYMKKWETNSGWYSFVRNLYQSIDRKSYEIFQNYSLLYHCLQTRLTLTHDIVYKGFSCLLVKFFFFNFPNISYIINRTKRHKHSRWRNYFCWWNLLIGVLVGYPSPKSIQSVILSEKLIDTCNKSFGGKGSHNRRALYNYPSDSFEGHYMLFHVI